MITVAHSGLSAGGNDVMTKIIANSKVDILSPQLYGKDGSSFETNADAVPWSDFASSSAKIVPAVPTGTSLSQVQAILPVDGLMIWPH